MINAPADLMGVSRYTLNAYIVTFAAWNCSRSLVFFISGAQHTGFTNTHVDEILASCDSTRIVKRDAVTFE